ncbi:MAG TPA: GEVED domain-containing protein, partial [Bacteroidia bacterium]
MKRLITNLKMLRFSLLALLTGSAMITANAQSPWCAANNPGSQYMSSGGYYYGIIEQTRISAGNTLVFNKPADGYKSSVTGTCGAGWSLINSPSNAINLTAGNTYTIEFSTSTSYSGGYTANFGLYIDLNKDNDFTDNGEMFSSSSWSATGTVAYTPGSLSSYKFTIPCSITPGATRMRVRSDMNWYGGFTQNQGCHTGSCNDYSHYYGETDDYSINLQLPTSLSANFNIPSTIWVKTVNKFINSNQSGYIEHAWDAGNDGSFEQVGVGADYSNPSNLWNTPGNKCLKLRSTNCLGKDSIVKCFNVNAPTSVPVVDFVADRVEIPILESVRFFDLSKNGPYEWTWDVYDSTTYAAQNEYPSLSGGEVISDPWGNNFDEFSQNPEFSFDIPGCYTVVLTCKNDVGPSAPKKKVCYITVTLPTDYLIGYGVWGPNADNIVGSTSGNIYDDYGPKGNYSNNQGLGSRSFLQITPCNAQKIVLTMSQLKFKDAGDKLSVWDGRSPGGPGTTLLATWSVGAKAPQTVTATSGSMYILFEADAGGQDSGYIGSYTSELGPANLPVPAFIPSTVPSYNATPVKFTNTTSNIVGVPTWEWTVNDDQEPNNNKKDFNYTFSSDGQYKVCLEIKSCVGNNKSCTTINVVTPNTQTMLDLKASKRRPNINVDQTVLTPISDNANRFEYTIFPTTYTLMNPPSAPSSYGAGFIKYAWNPGDSIPTPILKFSNAGCYTITLKAWNSNDQTNTVKTIVKNKFICALNYCVPNSFILSGDVGINRVKVLDGTTELINNYTTSGDAAYTDYSSEKIANMTYGRTYRIELSRTSTVDPANRKAWIDWNIDGDFDDQDEEILFESAANTQVYSKDVTVPALAQSFEGITRLRVAANYNNESTTSCGPITAGEFEDYGILLANDNALPIITLNGEDTVRIEVGSTYTDAGATAWDVSEGDITSEMVTTNDLETTITGLYTYEYNVTDKSGNKAITKTRTIIVVNDLTSPILTLNPGSTGCITARRDNPPYVDPGANATDNKAPFSLTSSILKEGTVNTRVVGNYTITYSVQDVA